MRSAPERACELAHRNGWLYLYEMLPESHDPNEFGNRVEPYRRELFLHCYRLLGSLHDAEDLVQETMVRAWQHFATFQRRASLRAWLYTIATNVCLDALKQQTRRLLPPIAYPAGDPLSPIAPPLIEPIWLEPFPDSWLSEATEDPAVRYTRRESVSLAFLTVLQLLPPRQRAIVLLSDVLDWHASEIADLLSISVSAVNSALHRARVTLAKQYQTDDRARTERVSQADAATQALLGRYLHAWETQDVTELVTLLREDATVAMPPSPSWFRGRDAIQAALATQVFAPRSPIQWHFAPTRANGCPAFAAYRSVEPGSGYQAFGIHVLTLDAGASGVLIASVTAFLNPTLLTFFDLPPVVHR